MESHKIRVPNHQPGLPSPIAKRFIWGTLRIWESCDPHRGGDAISRVRTEGVVELVLVLPANVEHVEHRATKSDIGPP